MRTRRWLFLGCFAIGCSASGSDDPAGPRDGSGISDGWSDIGEEDETTPADSAEPDSAATVDSNADDVAGDTDDESDAGTDSTLVDAEADTLVIDSAPTDGGSMDSSKADSGKADSGKADSGKPDTGTPDTGTPDTGLPDSGAPDTAMPDTGVPDSGMPDTYVDPCVIALSYDFEASDQGFTHAPLSTYASDDPWARGTPTSTMKCHTGKCFTTGLTANYATCQTAALSTPVLDVSKCATSSKKVTFSFWHYYDFEALSAGHYWDGGVLQVSTDGTTWTDVTTSQPYDGALKGDFSGCTPVPLIDGKSGWSGTISGGAWKQVTYDVPVSQRVATLRFRFLFGSDAASNKRGWYVDDVALISSP